MKKGQVYEGVIESVEFPNKGIVNVPQEDRRVIVKNGVPGQKVRFSVNKVKKGKAEGKLLEVIEKASQEIEPDCPHFGQCGGCTYSRASSLAMRWPSVPWTMTYSSPNSLQMRMPVAISSARWAWIWTGSSRRTTGSRASSFASNSGFSSSGSAAARF